MAIQGSILDYTGAAGDRNSTVYIQLAFSGSYTAGGDTLNLTGSGTLPLLNPNGLEVEGFFENPLTLAPAPYIENLDGAYTQPVISVNTGNVATTQGPLSAQLIQCFLASGAEVTAGTYSSEAPAFPLGTVIYTFTKRRV